MASRALASTGPAGVRRARLKDILASGGYATGTWLQFVRTPAVVRMIAAAGFDAVFIDAEHSSFDWETIADMCELARAEGITPVVRPPEIRGPLVNRVQDLGAMGLIFHDITSRSQVETLLRTIHYPPSGVRGVSAGAAPTDYRVGPGRELQAFVNEQTLLAIQIESAAGIRELDRILTGGGVDLVEIGRNDLSTSLGVPLESRHPLVLEAVDHVVDTAARHKVAVGVTATSDEDAADLVRRGVRCIAYGIDKNVIAGAYRSMAARLSSLIGARRPPAEEGRRA